MDGRKFAPSRDMDAFKSTFNNGNYYAAIFNDYCLRQNTATQFTDRLIQCPDIILQIELSGFIFFHSIKIEDYVVLTMMT